MNCCICYNDIKELDLIKAGCCSIIICKNCIKLNPDDKCPQCRKVYFWINDYQCLYNTLASQYNQIMIKNDWLKAKVELLHNQNNDLIKGLINNNKEICKLQDEILMMKSQKENEEYLNRLIQIHHLNII
jgi:hypothetical protein